MKERAAAKVFMNPDVAFEHMPFREQKVYIIHHLVDLWSKCLGDEIELWDYDDCITLNVDGKVLGVIGLGGNSLEECFITTYNRLQRLINDAR